MSKREEMISIALEIQRRLRDEILFWQAKALAASGADDQVAVRTCLVRQAQAIEALNKYVETGLRVDA